MIQDIEPKHLYNEWKKNAVPKKSSAVVLFDEIEKAHPEVFNAMLQIFDEGHLTDGSGRKVDFRNTIIIMTSNVGSRAVVRKSVQVGYSTTSKSAVADRTPQSEYCKALEHTFAPEFLNRIDDIVLFRTEKPKELAYAAVSAWHLCSWYRDARWCGRCGEKLVHDVNERMMRCPRCGNMIFPRINPSVIVAVTHGDYLLLTKYANRPGAQRTALIAGFTEFAESFEQTVHREVMEEVGLKVRDLRYYRCQPWGISGNIMMGFWCRLDGDDDTIRLDQFELADGAWVSREELRKTFVGNGVALTSEMISEFAAGRDPYSMEKE